MVQGNGSDPLETILVRLRDYSGEVRKKSSGGYLAWCPAHEDQQKRSLSIGEGERGQVILHCFAGCTSSGPESVCKALGLTVGDLFPDNGAQVVSIHSGASREEYVYRHANGIPAYKIKRIKGKKFYPYVYDAYAERFVSRSGFPPGTERLPYRLNEWVNGTETLYWVEGEKDVDRLMSLGFTATTSHGGASGILPDLEWLRGRKVIIIPDNDEPGRKYGRRVAEGLERVAFAVSWLELPGLPDQGDVSDYFDTGATVEEFYALAIDAPLYDYTEHPEGNPKPKPKKSSKVKTEKLGHDELRDRWLTRYPGMAWSRGDWHRYTAGYWSPVAPEVVEDQVIRILEDAWEEGTKVTGHLVGSVLRLARAATFLDPALWDANPDALVLGNGTLDISKRVLREHREDDYSTSTLPYDYDPDADAAVFRAAIDQAVPDAHGLLQEFAGYALTTDTSLETALWLKGPRGCGKSTVIEGYVSMLGDRQDILGLAEIEHSSFALTRIPGKTLLTSTEQPASYIKSTHVINALISGELINVDRKNRDAEQVRPIAKLIWAMNEAPRTASSHEGIFRRVHIIAFPALKNAPNPAVKEKIKQEGAGILNWALEGLARLEERGGFTLPASVKTATEEWEESNDLPAQFVDEKCVTGDQHEISSRVLYSAYVEWVRDGGHQPVSINRIGDDWKRLGFWYRKTNNGRFWKGVQLKNREQED